MNLSIIRFILLSKENALKKKKSPKFTLKGAIKDYLPREFH